MGYLAPLKLCKVTSPVISSISVSKCSKGRPLELLYQAVCCRVSLPCDMSLGVTLTVSHQVSLPMSKLASLWCQSKVAASLHGVSPISIQETPCNFVHEYCMVFKTFQFTSGQQKIYLESVRLSVLVKYPWKSMVSITFQGDHME